MPIELKKKTATKAEEAAPEAGGLMLFTEDGELTLPGEAIADFLEACDFTPVVESEDARPFLVLAEDGEEDEEDEDADGDGDDGDASESADEVAPVVVYLPGPVAARLVDEGDLVDMFSHYLGTIAEGVEESDEAMLTERATLACFADVLDGDGDVSEDQREAVAEMLRSVIEGTDIAAEVSEKFLTKGQRLKVSRLRKKPKSGKRRMELKKRRREEGRGAKKAKIGRQKKMFKRRRSSRLKMLARESTEEQLVLGFGEGTEGVAYRVGVTETPDLDFDFDILLALEEQGGHTLVCQDEDCGHEDSFSAFLDEKGKIPPQFLSKKKGKKKDADGDGDDSTKGEKSEDADGVKKGLGAMAYEGLDEKEMKCPKCGAKFDTEDGEDDGDEEDGKGAGKKKTEEARPPAATGGPIAGPFAAVGGRPSLDEGSSLAASTLATMGIGRKTLSEDED